jgi:hypothetical protein
VKPQQRFVPCLFPSNVDDAAARCLVPEPLSFFVALRPIVPSTRGTTNGTTSARRIPFLVTEPRNPRAVNSSRSTAICKSHLPALRLLCLLQKYDRWSTGFSIVRHALITQFIAVSYRLSSRAHDVHCGLRETLTLSKFMNSPS